MIPVQYFIHIAALASIWAMLALALNLQYAYGGLINFGVVAYFGIGGYTYAILTSPMTLGFSWIIGFVGAIVLTAATGYLTAKPFLRLRAAYLAITALAFGEILRFVYRNETWLTRGLRGLYPVDQPLKSVFAENYTLFADLIIIITLVLIFIAVNRITGSPFGRVLRAIKADERITEAIGKDVHNYRLLAWVIGSVIMGLAGLLYIYNQNYIYPDMFTPELTFYIWVVVVLGGLGSNSGVVLGAFILQIFNEGTSYLIGITGATQFAILRIAIYGILLVILLRFRPKGIMGKFRL